MKKIITAGNIKRAIKAKKTWPQLEQEYGCTQDEIEMRIKDLFRGGGDNIIRQISGNTNAREKQSRRRSTDASVGNSRVANPTSSSRPIKAAPNPAEQLEELKRYGNEVLEEIVTLQNERGQLVNRLHYHASELQKLAEELKEIAQSFRSWIERCKRIIKDVGEARKKLSRIDKLIQEKKGLCKSAREWQDAIKESTETHAQCVEKPNHTTMADIESGEIAGITIDAVEFQSLKPSERLKIVRGIYMLQDCEQILKL